MKKSNHLWLLAFSFACLLAASTVGWAQNAEPATNDVTTAEAPDAVTNTNEASQELTKEERNIHRRGPIVVWGRDVELKAGEEAASVVVFGGNAKIHGKVKDAVVVLFGNAEIDNEVHDSAVTILGSIKLRSGAAIHDSAVAILGDIEADEGSSVRDASVSIGGLVNAHEGSKMNGPIESLDVPQFIKVWLTQCALKLRPLAPTMGWLWIVPALFVLFYMFITAVFPRPVQVCVNELTNRPATTFFVGLLTKMLIPVVTSILALTVIGAIVVPFLTAAIFLGALVGKAALLQRIGAKFSKFAPEGELQRPLVALIIGCVFITVLYMIPIIGLLTFMIIGIWGLGGAVTAALASLKRETPPKPAFAPAAPRVPPFIPGEPGQAASASFAEQPLPGEAPLSAMPEAFRYPRARLLERIGAGAIDLILVSVVCKGLHMGGLWPFAALAYFVALWTWKATTVGGIIFGLKVARVDGQRLTLVVALVRALGAAFSTMVLFLGFLWIAWDREKQGWHDQITGTVVIRMPRGTPLVCF